MLPQSICYSCKSPNDLFCKKPKKILSCPSLLPSRHQLRYHSNFQNNWSRERPWNHLAPMSLGKVSEKRVTDRPPCWSQNRILSLHCQWLCIAFITVQILAATTTVKLLKGSKNKRGQTKNIWWVNYLIQLMNRYRGGQLRDISEVSQVGVTTIQ